MIPQLYCPACSNYLMASDGECHNCPCGWNQPPSTCEDNDDEIQRLRKQVTDQQNEIERLREGILQIHITEDSYDDEQSVLSEIYLICEKLSHE